MSWMYGYLFKQVQHELAPRFRSALTEYHSSAVSIFAGGNPNTCVNLCHPSDASKQVFILGNPILQQDLDYKYPTDKDWQDILSDENKLRSIDGHWVVLIAAPDSITAWNDSLCKRTMYLHEDESRIFFTTDISLLKSVCKPLLSYKDFGVYWHSVFPPVIAGSRFAPTQKSYYKDVLMLGSGGKAEISCHGIKLSSSVWNPSREPYDLSTLLTNMTLLPVRADKKVILGLSGGMDVRPLLAIYLAAGAKLETVHFGNDTSADYNVASRIAKKYGLPLRLLRYEDSGVSWEQASEYLDSRGFGFNPANCNFMGYYPKLAQDNEVYVSGYFGELYRFRFLMAYLKTALATKTLDYQTLGRTIYADPKSFFIPEVCKTMQDGFWDSLRSEAEKMPSSKEMPNPMWMHLFLVRYGPRSINMPNLAWIDEHLIDHMPYLHSSIISEHWRFGFGKQFNEGLHRSIISKNFPELKGFPIALSDVSVPYYYRQFAMKLKMWAHYRRTPLLQLTRSDSFLLTHRQQIEELARGSRISTDPAIDRIKLNSIIKGYYNGDRSFMGSMLSFVSYALGK